MFLDRLLKNDDQNIDYYQLKVVGVSEMEICSQGRMLLLVMMVVDIISKLCAKTIKASCFYRHPVVLVLVRERLIVRRSYFQSRLPKYHR